MAAAAVWSAPRPASTAAAAVVSLARLPALRVVTAPAQTARARLALASRRLRIPQHCILGSDRVVAVPQRQRQPTVGATFMAARVVVLVAVLMSPRALVASARRVVPSTVLPAAPLVPLARQARAVLVALVARLIGRLAALAVVVAVDQVAPT